VFDAGIRDDCILRNRAKRRVGDMDAQAGATRDSGSNPYFEDLPETWAM